MLDRIDLFNWWFCRWTGLNLLRSDRNGKVLVDKLLISQQIVLGQFAVIRTNFRTKA